MSKWEMVKIEECCDFIDYRGKTPEKSKEGIPIITAKNVRGNSFCIEPREFIPADSYESVMTRGIPKENDILFTTEAPLGNVCRIPHFETKFAVGQRIIVMQPKKNKILAKFLEYSLKSNTFQREMWKYSTGSTVKGIRSKELVKLCISLPSLEFQRHISDTLSKTQEIIDIHKKQLEELDNFIKATFYDMFGDPVINEKQWDKKNLSEMAEIITGNTPPRKDKDNYGDYIEWIKSDNITKNYLYITKATESLSEKGYKIGRYVKKNSILMTCIAGSISSIGNVAITDRKVSFNQQINGIVPLSCNCYYLYVLFLQTQKYIQSTINMSLKGILSKGKLSELKFILPPLELQNKFAQIVANIEEQKSIVKQSITESQNLFNSLMSRYFD